MTRYAIVTDSTPTWASKNAVLDHVSSIAGRSVPDHIVFRWSEQELAVYRVYKPINTGQGPAYYEQSSAPALTYDVDQNKVFATRVNVALSEEAADQKAQQLINQARDRVVAFAEQMGEQIAGKVPMDEKLSWYKKEEAARAFKADTHTDAQLALLSSEIAITQASGIDVDLNALVDKIIASADVYTNAAAQIAGVRRAVMASITALGNRPTPEQIETTLEAAQTDASAKFQAFLASL